MAGRGDIEAGKAHILLYLKNSALVKGLNAVKGQLQSVGSAVMKSGGAISAAGASILAPIGAAVQQFIGMGTELDNVSKRTGLGVQALAEFKHAAEQTGASLGDVAGASKAITKTIADASMGGSGAAVALSRLGLTADGLKKQLPEEQLQTIADRLNGVKDPAIQAALATQLLGGTNLLPMVRQLGDLRKEARNLGLVPTEKAVADAANLGKMLDRALSVVWASVFEVGAAVAPVLFPIGDAIINIAATVNRWVRENHGLIRTIALVAAGVFAVGVGVTAVGALIFGLGTAFGLVASAVMAVGSALAFVMSPLGLVVAALAAGTVYWLKFTESGKQTLGAIGNLVGDLKETIGTMFGGIGDALKGGDLQLAAQIAMKGIQLVFMQGVQAITGLIGGQIGDTFGTIASKVIKGDFMGAWQTALKQLASWHASVVEGITALYTMGARAAVDAWRNSVNAISDFLLEASAKGGALGKVASGILGVDMKKEKDRNAVDTARSDAINRKQNERDLAHFRKMLAEAESKGDTAGADLARRGIAGRERDLAKWNGGGADFMDEAKNAARDQTNAIADNLKKRLDQMDLAAQAKTDAAEDELSNDTAGGADALAGEIAALKAELMAFRNQAKGVAANAIKGVAGGPIKPPPEVVNATALRQGFGTFSGVALGLGGSDGGFAKRQLRVQEEARELQRRQLAEQERQRAATEAIVKNLGVV